MRPDLELSYSPKPMRAREIGRDAYCINYHTQIGQIRNLNVKDSYLNGFFYADKFGYSGWSSIHDMPFLPHLIDRERARSYYFDVIWKLYLVRRLTKYPQKILNEQTLPRNYLLFPLQVPSDPTLHNAYLSLDELVASALSIAADVPVVIKPHPKSGAKHSKWVSYIRSLHNPAKGIHISNEHIHRLITNSAGVVCINSGAGMEAVLMGKPVILCGKADYHHVCRTVKSAQELVDAVRNLRPPNAETVFAYAK